MRTIALIILLFIPVFKNTKQKKVEPKKVFIFEPKKVWSKKELECMANYYADSIGVCRKIVKKIIRIESNWQIEEMSNKGAKGLMQLMPCHIDSIGAMNPKKNLITGITFLKYLLDKYSLDTALCCYNMGEKKFFRELPDVKTMEYLLKFKNAK